MRIPRLEVTYVSEDLFSSKEIGDIRTETTKKRIEIDLFYGRNELSEFIVSEQGNLINIYLRHRYPSEDSLVASYDKEVFIKAVIVF